MANGTTRAVTQARALAAFFAFALGASFALGACKEKPLPPPDPQGKDLVPGAIVAAVTTGEPTPGIRTYKIIHAIDLPPPMGQRLDLTAYDPKAPSFEDAARAWKAGGMQVVMEHVEVQTPVFLKRDHRVLAVEPVVIGDAGKGGPPPGPVGSAPTPAGGDAGADAGAPR
jgi:hypothetical protein